MAWPLRIEFAGAVYPFRASGRGRAAALNVRRSVGRDTPGIGCLHRPHAQSVGQEAWRPGRSAVGAFSKAGGLRAYSSAGLPVKRVAAAHRPDDFQRRNDPNGHPEREQKGSKKHDSIPWRLLGISERPTGSPDGKRDSLSPRRTGDGIMQSQCRSVPGHADWAQPTYCQDLMQDCRTPAPPKPRSAPSDRLHTERHATLGMRSQPRPVGLHTLPLRTGVTYYLGSSVSRCRQPWFQGRHTACAYYISVACT